MFDKTAYRDGVLKPLQVNRSAQGSIADALRGVNESRDLDSFTRALSLTDPAALFAIKPGATDAELADHLKSVETFLNKGLPPVAKTLGQLLKAIKGKCGALGIPGGYASAQLWRDVSSIAADAARQKLDAFAAELRMQEPLGVITPERLRAVATAAGVPVSLDNAGLATAVGAHGVAVCPDFEVPNVALTQVPLKKELHATYRSPVDVLVQFEGTKPAGISVIDELSYEAGGPRRQLTLGAIAKSKEILAPRSDDASESARKTLNAIQGVCESDKALRNLILAWFVDLASDLVRKQGMLSVTALGKLTERGLAELDAKRVIAKATVVGTGPGVDDVRQFIRSGEIHSARRLLASLSEGADGGGSPALAQVAAALAEAEAAKTAAMGQYADALMRQDYVTAAQALRNATAIDKEDNELVRLLEQLPPAPPTQVSVQYDSAKRQVMVSWRGDGGGDLRYAVTRSDTGTPANPRAGHQLAAAVAETQAIDPAPVVGAKVTYAVFAFRPGASYSLPGTTEYLLLPPPAEVNAAVTTSAATVFWHAAPESSGVSAEVSTAAGYLRSLPPTTAQNRVQIEGLDLGQRYTVTLRAHYTVAGQPCTSAPVSIDVTPRGVAQAVTDLAIQSLPMPDGQPGVRATWSDVVGFRIDLWSLPVDVQLVPGTRVTEASLENIGGKRVIGNVRSARRQQTIDAYAFRDVRVVVPITWADTDGLVGNGVVAGSAPPPREVEAIRLGSELLVSWHWPHGDYAMDVETRTGDGQTQKRRVDRVTYNTDGGCRIPRAGDVVEVRIATVARGNGQDFVFSPVTIRLDSSPPTVAYTLKLPHGLFGGRKATVEVSSSDRVGVVNLIAVLSGGSYMPVAAADGDVIARLSFDFGAAATHTASFTLPKLRSPFWVRLFPAIEGTVILREPSTSTLKG